MIEGVAMPITSTTDPSRDLTTLTATGKITLEEVIEVVKTFKYDPPAINIVWDYSKAYPDDPFDATDMDRIAALATTNLNLREQPNGKTAFVAASDFIFGLARMYTTYLELQGPSHEIQVFRSLDEAHE
jgi:hypothetical protein